MHFQHSGAEIRLFEQNTDIIKFWLFIQWQNMNTLFKLGNFQRKVGGEFMWNSQQISPATSSYWEPCYIQPFI